MESNLPWGCRKEASTTGALGLMVMALYPILCDITRGGLGDGHTAIVQRKELVRHFICVELGVRDSADYI